MRGKYSDLIQTVPCPGDRKKQGEFKDFGYFGGGKRCGKYGKAGYYVYVSPNWYVWAIKGIESKTPLKACADGKCSGLLQVLNCPKDKPRYGGYKDYGYFGGGEWCLKYGHEGYYVYVAPNWYVWKERAK